MSQFNDHMDVHKVRKIISFNKNLQKVQRSLRRRVSEKIMIQCMYQLLSYPMILIEKLNFQYVTSRKWFMYRSSCIEDDNPKTLNHSYSLLKKIDSEQESDFIDKNIEISENELELNKKFEEKLKLLERNTLNNGDSNNSTTIMFPDSNIKSTLTNKKEFGSTKVNVTKTIKQLSQSTLLTPCYVIIDARTSLSINTK